MPGGSRDFDPDVDASAAGLLALARHNIPVDVQELLVYGNPTLGVPPGALSACLRATLEAYQKQKQS